MWTRVPLRWHVCKATYVDNIISPLFGLSSVTTASFLLNPLKTERRKEGRKEGRKKKRKKEA
jgi:hypothetical protein